MVYNRLPNFPRFYRAAEFRRGLATRILSVCPSIKRVDCDKTEEQSVQMFMPYERTFNLHVVFWEEELVRPRWSEIRYFEPIFARSASAVTHSEKSSINTNRKSTTRLPVSLRWSSYVVHKSPEGSSKRKTVDLGMKSQFASKKSAIYKVSLFENCQLKSCKAFIGLTIRAKMIGGGHPLLPEILSRTESVEAKSPIFVLFSPVAPQS